MADVLTFALLGVGIGATYAIAAMGIVVVYRGSGLVNFAHVGMAVAGAFVYAEARDGGAPEIAAVLAGLACSAAIGLATHLLVMQRLQRASTLTRVVATLGLLIVLQSGALLIYGDGIRLVPSLLPTTTVDIGGASVGADRLWLAAISMVVGAVLWAVYRFTGFGRLTTAVAENARAVAALGRSPQRAAMVNWVVGAILAGAAGILLAPVVGLSVPQISLLLIPALAAALVGGFSSFGLAWAGAMAIGVAQSEITRYVSAPGWSSAVPILIVIAILLLRGRTLPQRGALHERLPAVGSGAIRAPVVVAAVGSVVLLVSVLNGAWIDAITTALITALVCLSLTVVSGYAGQLSLAQFALAGVGALVAARTASAWDLPFWLAGVLAVIATTAAGVVVALPALRIRGVTLGIVTLGIAVVVQQVLLSNPAYTGGALGTTVEPPSLGGLSLDATAHPARFALLCLAILVVAGWVVSNLRRATTGRRLLALRGNERAAASLGLDVVRLKLYAFAVSAGLASLAGVLFAFRSPDVVFESYTPQRSIDVLGTTVIGGLGYIGGALMAGAISAGGPVAYALDHVTGSREWLGLLTGLVMLVTLAVAPDGMFALKAELGRRAAARLRRRPPPPAPAPPAAGAPTMHRGPHRRLSAEHLSVSFGGTRALEDVSLRVQSGEVLGVIGPNGAGKTTLIDVITGLTRADRGSVMLDDAEITGRSVSARARLGVVRSYQSLELFDDLTVLDNLRVPSESGGGAAWLTDLLRPREPELAPAVAIAIEELRLARVLGVRCSELPYGQRRLVAIARALAAEPSVLLLDEPAAGLDEEDRAELAGLLRRLADDWGLAVLVVEHDVSLVVEVSDRVLVLDAGRVIAERSPDAVLREPAVVEAYLGGASDHPIAAGTEDDA